MSNAGGGRPIPGKTYNEADVIRGDAPDEPVEAEDAVDRDKGVIGVAEDDTVGVNQDDDDRR